MADVLLAGQELAETRGVLQPAGRVVDPRRRGQPARTRRQGVGGSLRAWDYFPDQAAADAAAQTFGALAGDWQTVTHRGYALGEGYLAQVHARVRRVRGVDPAAPWRLDLELAFDADAGQGGSQGGLVAELFPGARVYCGPTLATLVEVPALRARAAVSGWVPQVIGSASLIANCDPATPAPAVVGLLVRLDLPDDPAEPALWTPAWYGRVIGQDFTPNRDGGAGAEYAVYECRELTGELAGHLVQWYEAGGAGRLPVDRWLGANVAPGGDRSAALLDGQYWHDRRAGQGVPWRAREYLDSALSLLASAWDSDILWVRAGVAEALGNLDQAEPDGGSVLDLMVGYGAAGLGARLSVAGSVASLVWDTSLAAALAIGDFSLPANAAQRTLDLGALDPAVADSWRLYVDAAQVRDLIYVRGGEPWMVSTLGPDQLEPGWDAAAAAAWEAAAEEDRGAEALAQVYRRWVLRPDWQGGSYLAPTDALAATRETVTSAAHGLLGETGDWQAGGAWSPRAVRFTKLLPLQAGVDYRDGPSSATRPDCEQELQRPMVFAVRDGSWELLDLPLTIADDQGALLLGEGVADQEDLRQRLADGWEIVVTVGWLFPLPWRVSWRSPAPPAQAVRCIEYQAPEVRYEQMQPDTVLGVAGTAPVVVAGGGILGDQDPGLGERLALARAAHERPAVRASWEAPGLVLGTGAEDLYPGTLVTEWRTPGGQTIAQASMVVARGWTFAAGAPRTHYQAMTLLPGVRPQVRRLAQPLRDWLQAAQEAYLQ